MADRIPQAVLSDTLRSQIGERRVKAAVFLSFGFDPGFFEEEIVPALFAQSFSHVPRLRLVQLEEALRGVPNLAVYYDRRALVREAQPARLDYERIGLARAGFFHPKNILILLETNEADQVYDSLLLGILSANLTRSGWWENVEAAHFDELESGAKSSVRNDLLEFIARVKREDHTGAEHAGLEAVRAFLLKETTAPSQRRQDHRWRTQLFYGQSTLPEFLSEFIARESFNLEIISPYFDENGSAATLQGLLSVLQPKETRLYLPIGPDGAALCRADYFEAVKGLDVRWSNLPSDILAASQRQQPRFVHAKVYRFWKYDREIYFIGSVNLTAPGHSPARAGNLESGVLVEPELAGRPGWWLAPILDDAPAVFRPEAASEVAPEPQVGAVSFRFDWETGRLDYFWESTPALAGTVAAVSAQGVPLFRLEPIAFDAWIELPAETAQRVGQVLASISFLEIGVAGSEPFRVLVREVNMAHKPSLVHTLSVEDILQYWSLLSAEQREAFLIERLPSLADGTELAAIAERLAQSNTLFDRFAGIFHAFGALEQHVREALAAGRRPEAVYRLFGQRHDSLPGLIDKVAEDQKGDLVNRYVTLLCARQLITKLAQRDAPDAKLAAFAQEQRTAFEQLGARLTVVDTVREQFAFDTVAERQQFFDWFDRMFLRELAPAAMEAQS